MPIKLTLTPDALPADLEINIRYESEVLTYYLHSSIASYTHFQCGSTNITNKINELISKLYTEISKSRNEKDLIEIGEDLWEQLFPKKLKDQYWLFRDKVHSIQLTTNDSWIPWEIIKPFEYGGKKSDDFFCQQFSISRWLSGEHAPQQVFQPGVARLAATDDKSVVQEVSFIEKLSSLHPGILVLPRMSKVQEVLDCVHKEPFTFLHFAGHGGVDKTKVNGSMIQLSDGLLKSTSLRARFDSWPSRPLIFLNACDVGKLQSSISEPTGWAYQLVEKTRVGAFIGAMWDIDSELALTFTKEFYKHLLKDNMTIAEAFREARQFIRKVNPNDPTWLAYVLYSHPNAKFKEITIELLISQLHQAIEHDDYLTNDEKEDVLENFDILRDLSEHYTLNNEQQKKAQNAIRYLRGIIVEVPKARRYIEACNRLLPTISEKLGLS